MLNRMAGCQDIHSNFFEEVGSRREWSPLWIGDHGLTVVVSDCEGFLPQVAVIRPVRARRGWSELRRKWHHSTNCLSFWLQGYIWNGEITGQRSHPARVLFNRSPMALREDAGNQSMAAGDSSVCHLSIPPLPPLNAGEIALLPNQSWVCLATKSKADLLTLGCGEENCGVCCRSQARSLGS